LGQDGCLFCMTLSTDYQSILEKVESFDPSSYARSRNYIDGGVSYLSPYISRGVISTRMVYKNLLERGYDPKRIEKFIQELAWRDHWQQNWIALGERINEAVRQPQSDVAHHEMPTAVDEAKTGIHAIDEGIERLYTSGYMHNHMRMYVAALTCNMAKSHWLMPARWMYYHLLDGDWASNALSWQWVAGANSGKKYYANQGNIDRYTRSTQPGSYLDHSYEYLVEHEIPSELNQTASLSLRTPLPKPMPIIFDQRIPTLIYNWYNLDPAWRKDEKVNRILLLEPSIFERYPISASSVQFMLDLAKNISDIQVYVGEFQELRSKLELQDFIYKEHPLNSHYEGTEDARDWMFDVQGFHRSFFAFWKKCQKQMKQPSLF
jgi:deoxyribodipyrimidine photo-lyase